MPETRLQSLPANPPSRFRWGCFEVGCLLLFVLLLASLLLPPGFGQGPRRAPRTAACMSNLKQISMALALYADDRDSRFPPAGVWQASLKDYLPNLNAGVFSCPEAKAPVGDAFNQTLGGISRKRVVSPAETPLVFDSYLPGPNATDMLQSFARRHEWRGRGGWGNVAFADGHVRALRAAPPSGAGIRR
jgi:prepilin-type processing-associated H-X9-DG protein